MEKKSWEESLAEHSSRTLLVGRAASLMVKKKMMMKMKMMMNLVLVVE